jgi:DNA-binding MarR family transcriptional regulator
MCLNRKLRASSLGGLSPAQASMLAAIDKLDRPSLGELALAEQIQPPSVTSLVKGLAAEGLINMLVDPSDRRFTRACLTALGRKELNAVRQRKTAFLERKILALSGDDQEKAEEFATFLEALIENE